ncbi:MAG: hypothetical protein CM15mP22_6770 [Gammaproteobacteria bacterium]|nr:MAG: hypothetical protein CM15mP22_6770 [Gammaproteobacteria bacterium]
MPSSGINASLIFLPSGVLMGIFCKFGLAEDNLPVEVTADDMMYEFFLLLHFQVSLTSV